MIKRTNIVHKIDEYNFLNIEMKYYIPIIVEEQYVSISPLLFDHISTILQKNYIMFQYIKPIIQYCKKLIY